MEEALSLGTSIGTPSKCARTKRKVVKTEGPDGKGSWVVAFAAFVINFIMAGLSRMSGIMFVAFIELFNVDRKSASMPFSVKSSTMNLLGPVVGILGQKYGIRKVSVIGGVLGTVSAAACFFADDINWITIMWGGVNGVGTALVTTLTTVVIAQYFDKYRTTASGMSFSGACVGSFIFPPLMDKLLQVYGLGGSFLIIAGITMHVLPAAMILRKPIWVKRAKKRLKDIESAAEDKLEKTPLKFCTKGDDHTGVDLNYLRTNGDLVFKLLTIELVDKEGKNVTITCPTKDEILKEMEDVYCFVGKKPISLVVSDVPPKLRIKFEGETSPPAESKIQPTRTSLGEDLRSPLQKSKSVAKEHETKSSLGEDLRSPVRKTKSFVGSNRIAQCKPFILSKLNELYNKSENQIMSSLKEKPLYSKGLEELRKLHKVYEAVKRRNIFSNSRRATPRPHKIVPKVLIPEEKGKSTESTDVWTNVKASVRLHANPMFLLIAFCRAIHFSTFIPAVTIIVDYVMDKGLVEEDGKYVIAFLSVGDLLGRLCFGWVTDRGFISLPKYMMIVMVIQGIFTASLPITNTMETILPTTAMYALLQGSVFVRHSVLISKYMKSDEQSIAMGCVNFFAGILGFAVPSYVGFFRDRLGSYDSIFYLNGVIGAFGGFLWMFEPIFVRQSADPPLEEYKNEEKV